MARKRKAGTGKKRTHKARKHKYSMTKAKKGGSKRPLSFLQSQYTKLGRIIKQRGGKV